MEEVCNNCDNLEKKLERSRSWNRFFKEKLINIDKLLHILNEFEHEKQRNIDLQLAYDQRSREWSQQQEQLIGLLQEIQPLRERLKIAEDEAASEKAQRIKHQDMEKSLHLTIEQLQAKISHMHSIANPVYIENLERKLTNYKIDNKKFKKEVEFNNNEIELLKSYITSNHEYIEKLQKKYYWALQKADEYGRHIPKGRNKDKLEEWDKVQTSLEEITETLKNQYDAYKKKQEEKHFGKHLKYTSALIPFLDWLTTYEFQPEELLSDDEDPVSELNKMISDTEDEANHLEVLLSDISIKKEKIISPKRKTTNVKNEKTPHKLETKNNKDTINNKKEITHKRTRKMNRRNSEKTNNDLKEQSNRLLDKNEKEHIAQKNEISKELDTQIESSIHEESPAKMNERNKNEEPPAKKILNDLYMSDTSCSESDFEETFKKPFSPKRKKSFTRQRVSTNNGKRLPQNDPKHFPMNPPSSADCVPRKDINKDIDDSVLKLILRELTFSPIKFSRFSEDSSSDEGEQLQFKRPLSIRRRNSQGFIPSLKKNESIRDDTSKESDQDELKTSKKKEKTGKNISEKSTKSPLSNRIMTRSRTKSYSSDTSDDCLPTPKRKRINKNSPNIKEDISQNDSLNLSDTKVNQGKSTDYQEVKNNDQESNDVKNIDSSLLFDLSLSSSSEVEDSIKSPTTLSGRSKTKLVIDNKKMETLYDDFKHKKSLLDEDSNQNKSLLGKKAKIIVNKGNHKPINKSGIESPDCTRRVNTRSSYKSSAISKLDTKTDCNETNKDGEKNLHIDNNIEQAEENNDSIDSKTMVRKRVLDSPSKSDDFEVVLPKKHLNDDDELPNKLARVSNVTRKQPRNDGISDKEREVKQIMDNSDIVASKRLDDLFDDKTSNIKNELSNRSVQQDDDVLLKQQNVSQLSGDVVHKKRNKDLPTKQKNEVLPRKILQKKKIKHHNLFSDDASSDVDSSSSSHSKILGSNSLKDVNKSREPLNSSNDELILDIKESKKTIETDTKCISDIKNESISLYEKDDSNDDLQIDDSDDESFVSDSPEASEISSDDSDEDHLTRKQKVGKMDESSHYADLFYPKLSDSKLFEGGSKGNQKVIAETKPEDVSNNKKVVKKISPDSNFEGTEITKENKSIFDIEKKPVWKSFYQERSDKATESPERKESPTVMVEPLGDQSISDDEDDIESDELQKNFIHPHIGSVSILEDSYMNDCELKEIFWALMNSAIKKQNWKNYIHRLVEKIKSYPTQDPTTKLQSFVRCFLNHLLRMDFFDNDENFHSMPQEINKYLQIVMVLEIRLNFPKFYLSNLINMSIHKLILAKKLRANSLASLTRWIMSSFFIQYNQTETYEDTPLIHWARSFFVDLLFHQIGVAHKAILTAMNSSGKKVFIRIVNFRKTTCLENIVFWIIYHGMWIGEKAIRNTLIEDSRVKLGLRVAPPEKPEDVLRSIINVITEKNANEDERIVCCSAFLLMLQWVSPMWTKETFFKILKENQVKEFQTERATMHKIKNFVVDLINKGSWHKDIKESFIQEFNSFLPAK